jgi:uncharacterized protein (DUF111 family)
LDAYIVPCTMKKGRSGHLLSVLCYPKDVAKLEEYIIFHTSTLGVRTHAVERVVADRDWVNIKLNGESDIRVKIGRDLNGKIIHAQPEYEDCADFARSTGLPLTEVFKQALREFEGK